MARGTVILATPRRRRRFIWRSFAPRAWRPRSDDRASFASVALGHPTHRTAYFTRLKYSATLARTASSWPEEGYRTHRTLRPMPAATPDRESSPRAA
jgi:hypothetical protein